MRGAQARRRAATPLRQQEARPPRAWKGLMKALFTALLGLSLVSGLGWLVMELRDPGTLPLKAVKIEGEFRHLTAAQLEQAVAAEVNSGFFAVDVDAVRRAAEALPWVARTSVRRVWPDTLRLEVTEHQPLARWGEQALVSQDGQRFEPAPASIPDGLPRLAGPEPLREQVVAQYRSMDRVIQSLGYHIVRLTQDARRAWQVELDNGVELQLGRADPYPRLLRFVRVWPQVFAERMNGLQAVDLRYSNGFAARWQTQQTTQAEQQQEG